MMCAPPTGDRERCPVAHGDPAKIGPLACGVCGGTGWVAAPPTGDRGERPDHFCGPACEASGHAGVVRERPEDRLRNAHQQVIIERTKVDTRLRMTTADIDAAEREFNAALDALVADKAASDDVIEALAARIAELEAALTIMHRSYHGEALTDCICSRALAADPEGGPTDG